MGFSRAFYCFILVIILFRCAASSDVKEMQKIKKGELLSVQKEFDDALNCFLSVDATNFSDESKAYLYRSIANVYSKTGIIDSMYFYLEKALKISPKGSYFYYVSKAEIELFHRETSSALETLSEADMKFPNKAEIASLLSQIYAGNYGEGCFDLPKAEKYALRAFRLNQNNFNKEHLGSVYFDAEKYKLAAKIFREMYYQESDNNFYQFYYGQSMFFEGNEKKGFQLMSSAAEKNDSCKLMFDEIFNN